MRRQHHSWLMRYGVAAALVAITLWLRLLVDPWLGDRLPILPFGVAAMLAAWFGGVGPGLLAASVGAVVGDWFFNAPRHTLLLWEVAESAGLLMSILAATLISLLLRRLYDDLEKQKRTEELLQRQNEELKAMADQLRQHSAQLAEASAAKDHFLAALSHELRTPLTPVLLSAQSLAADPTVPAPLREELGMIGRNIELEARLIDDLLDLTRISRGKLELHRRLVDVHELLKHAVDTCCKGGLNGRGLEVKCELSGAEHWTYADPTRLEQVFWNLVNNALKFTPAGGGVVIRTANVERQGDKETRGQGEECGAPLPLSPCPRVSLSFLNIEISDTGIGIAPENLTCIFNAFEQGGQATTRRFGGLGLGLAICKAVVELHGGRIVAHSQGRDRGATFAVSLATMPAPVVRGMEPSAGSNADLKHQPLRILLVEDHQATLRAMKHLLEHRGYCVTTAESVDSARRAVDGGTYDMVVSDLGLPDGSGLDLMRQLKDRGLPGIALSGYGMEQDLRASREAGFSEHLTKPVNLQRLEATILAVAEKCAADSHRGEECRSPIRDK